MASQRNLDSDQPLSEDELPQQALSVPDHVDEEDFFTDEAGNRTTVTHSDLEATVPNREKNALRELDRDWVNKDYAFYVIYENVELSELRYFAVEPTLSQHERDILEFLKDRVGTSLDYDSVSTDVGPTEAARVLSSECENLLLRYDLVAKSTLNPNSSGLFGYLTNGIKEGLARVLESQRGSNGKNTAQRDVPQPVDPETGEWSKLSRKQVDKILYYITRDFIRFGPIDPLKQDGQIEDISVDGYNEPAFVYHTEYEQLVTNITFGEEDLDKFVVSLAQKARKGISKRQPNVDATLSDGSRANLSLGSETSAGGTNFTIRQFNDVPFTPIDLINWNTYSIDTMVYLWLAVETKKNIVVAGGTGSGKTTTLNALALFMPATDKVVSIEDTHELEIPQRNWVASLTRDSFQDGDAGEIGFYEQLVNALRQRPEYIVLGEVRGEEGRTLVQAMNTGHTVFTTFHADSHAEVVKRFVSEPISAQETMFESLDIILNQQQVTMGGSPVRRARTIVELGEFSSGGSNSGGKYSASTIYDWSPNDDRFHDRNRDNSEVLGTITREKGWEDHQLLSEWQRRKIVLAYLIDQGLTSYQTVAATLQAYMAKPERVLSLISRGELEEKQDKLRDMKNVSIDIDPEKEASIDRPTPSEELQRQVKRILASSTDTLQSYEDYSTTIENVERRISTERTQEISQGEDGPSPIESGRSASSAPDDDIPELDERDDVSSNIDEVDGELSELFNEDEQASETRRDMPYQTNGDGSGNEPVQSTESKSNGTTSGSNSSSGTRPTTDSAESQTDSADDQSSGDSDGNDPFADLEREPLSDHQSSPSESSEDRFSTTDDSSNDNDDSALSSLFEQTARDGEEQTENSDEGDGDDTGDDDDGTPLGAGLFGGGDE